MILALLAILLAEIATGLFSPGAPLAHHISPPSAPKSPAGTTPSSSSSSP